jgi:sec-independent protein translocase protein TatB
MFPENRMMEVLIIGALALIVIGPKDLPLVLRRVGQFVGKMRGMAAEFRASFDELARQSELDELRREVEALRSTPGQDGEKSPGTGVFDEIKSNLSLRTPPAMTALPQPELVKAPDPPAEPEIAEAAPKPVRKPRAKAAPVDGEPTAAKAPRKAKARATSSPT